MLLTPVITTQNACTLAKKVKMSILVSQKPDVMGEKRIADSNSIYPRTDKTFPDTRKKKFFVAV